eukprot:5213818-Ditylum_brightwellii.AAC.1
MEIGPVIHFSVIASGNVPTLRKGIRFAEDLGFEPPYLPHGPWPLNNKIGFRVALQTIRAPLEPGQYSSASQTFDTVRRLCAAFVNTYMSSADAHLQGIHFCGDRGASYHAVPYPTHSPLFELFMCGLLQ